MCWAAAEANTQLTVFGLSASKNNFLSFLFIRTDGNVYKELIPQAKSQLK